jgi:hypothetical protein
MKQKILYKFNVSLKDGEKESNYLVGVVSPKRTQREESELVYSEKYNELLDRGILPSAVLQKKLLASGANLDLEQTKQYEETTKQLAAVTLEYQNLISDLENVEANKERISKLSGEIAVLDQKCKEYENCKIDASDNSAESYAFQEVIRWLVLNLSVFKNAEDEKAEYVPLFKGTTYKEKLDALDEKEESEDKLYLESLNKLYRVCALIRYGATDPEKIQKYIDS